MNNPHRGMSALREKWGMPRQKRSSRELHVAWIDIGELATLAPQACVKRVIVVGPGAAGKSTLAACLGEITCLLVIELDKLFWHPGLAPTPREKWAAIQRQLAAQDSWIMDGDLGPYDLINVRLQAADTVVFLGFSPLRCAWRAIRRSRERADFWGWLLT
jgi:hypothetical protein